MIIRAFLAFLFMGLVLCGPCSSPLLAAAEKPVEQSEQAPGNSEEESPEAAAPVEDKAWEAVWSGQKELINEYREAAQNLGGSFASQAHDISGLLQPFQDEARRLLVFANTFRAYPNPMESVYRRMGAVIADIEQVLKPITMAREEAEGLLERVNQMASNLPDDSDPGFYSDEMRAYVQDIAHTRLRLTAVLAQYDSLLPSMSLLNRLKQKRTEIAAQLPALWENYYLQPPLAWLDPDNWINLKRDMSYSWQAMILRLPVELPNRAPQWGMAILRAAIGLFFAGILCLVLRRRLLVPDAAPAIKHMFRVSLPWLVGGVGLVGAAIAANGEFYRMFLAFGSGCLVLGQIYISWDLRRIEYPELTNVRPPFLRLLPLAFIAYLLLYLPLTGALALVLWVCLLTLRLFTLRHVRHRDYGPAQLETGILECDSVIVWLCLFVALAGLYIYSMAFYVAYLALAVACELSLAGMAIIGRINERLPQEGTRAALARLVVALAAPFVLVLALAGICLWLAMLPGGTYLIAKYVFKGISIGATQFNILNVLLIVSAFYLTRTIVAMGTQLLKKMPKLGINFDATLITPMQTFLTYATWGLFGLFVLRALGMDLQNLGLVAGGLSVGIGLGMQQIVNNFLSGLILIFGRTLRVGDVVEVGGLTGRIRKISVRATMVETYDNAIIYVPNSEFMAGKLINWTSFSRSVRRVVNVGVAYGSDTEKVITTLVGIAKAHANVLPYPVPSVNFADFGSSTLDFQLRFWVKDYELGASTMSDIRLAINTRFAEENIEIAFPQLDVHLKPEQDAPLPPARGTRIRTTAPRRISRPTPKKLPIRSTGSNAPAPADTAPQS